MFAIDGRAAVSVGNALRGVPRITRSDRNAAEGVPYRRQGIVHSSQESARTGRMTGVNKFAAKGSPMKSFLVVTITCADRPGIVEQVTDVVAAHGGNWEDSRLARLGGDFAGIVMVSVPPEKAEELSSALAALTNDEMTVAVKNTTPVAPTEHSGHALCALRLEGADHEGIVHDVSAYLAKQHINVEAMETGVASAPMTATPLFHMEAQLKVPPTLTVHELRENLQLIAEQLGVTIDVEPEPEHS